LDFNKTKFNEFRVKLKFFHFQKISDNYENGYRFLLQEEIGCKRFKYLKNIF